MCILSVLMILHNLDLNQKRPESLAVLTSSNVIEWNINPALWLLKVKAGEGDQIVIARASKESDASRGVGFVGFEVEVDTDRANGDESGEVYVEMVGLWSVGSNNINSAIACAPSWWGKFTARIAMYRRPSEHQRRNQACNY